MSSAATATKAAAAGGSSSTQAASGAAANHSGGDEIDCAQLMFIANLFVLGLLGLVVLWRLPRAIARFSTKFGWSSGHILRYVTPGATVNVTPMQISSPLYGGKEAFSDESHTSYGLKSLAASNIAPNFPPHVPSSWSFVRTFSSALQARIVPGYSIGQALLLFVYFCALIYLPFYSSNPFSDPVREGWIAMAQLPFVYVFASKNSPLNSLLGLGYEKLNFIHRFVGRLVVVMIDIHGFGYIYKWALAGTFYQKIVTASNTWGLVGMVAANMLILFSTEFWRKKAYNVFLYTHIIGWVLLIPSCWLHKKAMIPYMYAVIAAVGYDRLARMIKSRVTTAMLRPLPELGCTRIEIPNVNAGWTPGQHVRLRVLSSAMGIFGWSEIHPFTIASVSESPEGMVLMCKKSGTWTTRLFEAAKMGGYALQSGVERKVTVHVEGPYGGGGHTIFPSYSGALIVAGGSGITFALSTVQDMIQRDYTGENRVKVIDLVWSIQDPTALAPLLPTFTTLLEQAIYTNLRIHVYYTRSHSLETKLPFNPAYFPPALSLGPGRPKINKILDSVIDRTASLSGGPLNGKDQGPLKGVLVGTCGPVSLGDECARAVRSVDHSRRDQVGGVELHEEAFGW